MASVISAVTRGLTAATDLISLFESAEKVFQNQGARQNGALHKASIVNRLVCLGFTIAEVGMVLSGKKSEDLLTLKKIEILPRFAQLPLSACIETLDADESSRGAFKAFEKGIISPFADLFRLSAQYRCYYESRFLEMDPEKLSAEKRPIYETQAIGAEANQVITGYKAVDLEECKQNLASAEKSAASGAILRALAENGILEQMVFDLSIPLYERLAHFLRRDHRPAPAPAPAGQQAPQVADLDLNAANHPRIPLLLHEDDVFRAFICPITQEPIRDPVLDPTNGQTLYERHAILAWLNVDHISPTTRQPLEAADLLEAPAIRAIIDRRLQHHFLGVQNYLNEHRHDPIPPDDQPIVAQYQ